MLSSSARALAGSHTIHSSSATVSGRFIDGTISQAGPFLYLPSHDSSENVFAADAFALDPVRRDRVYRDARGREKSREPRGGSGHRHHLPRSLGDAAVLVQRRGQYDLPGASVV